MEKYNEEEKVYMAENDEDFLKVYNKVPYALIRQEIDVGIQDTLDEVTEICKYYRIYKKGKKFAVEGSNGDYVPAHLSYKMCYSLINKEARFLFAEQPDIKVKLKGDIDKQSEDSKISLAIMDDLLTTILSKNKFEGKLLKAAKDSFIGKRVACLVNFNEEDGVTISFLTSLQFLYETKIGNENVLTKFVCFTTVKESTTLTERRVFKKKFTLEDDGFAYIEETMYDGTGAQIEKITDKQPTKLTFIPAVVIINDGLTGETLGNSEVEDVMDFELWYSKLSNADKDAQRKSMNPVKYVVDMENNSTKNLSTAAGALWDLGSDQNLENAKTQVGLLEPQMNYSPALKTTLERIKTAGYEQVDMPNITNETMSGVITSGKALKAIYWPLIVRCKEKMKDWGPALSTMADIIIKGSIAYPNCIARYIQEPIVPVNYFISVEQNTPLPEDEIEEKTSNLAEVEANVMSKKTYMQRWYGLTNSQVNDELMQMALERQILDDSSFNNGFNGDNTPMRTYDDDFSMMGNNAIKSDGTDKRGDGSTGSVQNNAEITGNVDDSISSFSGSSQSNRLNATQTTSLIRILTQYKSGVLTKNQAIRIIVSMGMTEQFANSFLEEEKVGG
jgi:hypothetical protein